MVRPAVSKGRLGQNYWLWMAVGKEVMGSAAAVVLDPLPGDIQGCAKICKGSRASSRGGRRE
jgi:hypothetical protein